MPGKERGSDVDVLPVVRRVLQARLFTLRDVRAVTKCARICSECPDKEFAEQVPLIIAVTHGRRAVIPV